MSTNRELMRYRSNAAPCNIDQIHPILARQVESCRAWGIKGHEFLDFVGDIAVPNAGHLHPRIVFAVGVQLKKLFRTCFQVLAYEPYLELCEIMSKKVSGDFARKILLVTTGSKAAENVVKIAHATTRRTGTIALSGTYYGRTHYTLPLTGKVNPYSAGIGLIPGHMYRVLYSYPLHDTGKDDTIASVHRIFKNDTTPEDVTTIAIKPVQGEDSFYTASPSSM